MGLRFGALRREARDVTTLLNLADYEAAAEKRLSRAAWDYYRSGSGDEATLAENRAAFARVKLLHRVLADVSERDASCRLLGHALKAPIVVAPTAFHRLACDDGELATARAASAQGSLMILSSLSNTPVEAVAAAAGPIWFQLYVYRDRGVTRALVERVKQAGVRALVLTVDAPLLGRRERDVRNGFELPSHLSVANALPHGMGAVEAKGAESGLARYFAEMLDPSLTWADVEWLREVSDLPIVVKGIVRPDDAVRAFDHGARAVVVSNHGGRQLDGGVATIDALPRVADAVAGRGPLLLDGGVRRGVDALRALCLGATAVLIGRPVLWGLAVDGQAGAERVLDLLREELDLAMALIGARSLGELSRELVA